MNHILLDHAPKFCNQCGAKVRVPKLMSYDTQTGKKIEEPMSNLLECSNTYCYAMFHKVGEKWTAPK